MHHFFQVGHIKKLQKGIKDIQHGKMPRRLLHSTCGVTSVSMPPSTTGSVNNTLTVSMSSRTSMPRSPIFDDDDSYTIGPLNEESFG